VEALHQPEAATHMDLQLLLPRCLLMEVELVVGQLHPHLLMEAHLVHLQALTNIVVHHLHPVHLLAILMDLQLPRRHHLTAVHQVLAQALAAAQIHMVAHLVAVVQVILTTAHRLQIMFQYIIRKATKNN